jgi:hypothetical protein
MSFWKSDTRVSYAQRSVAIPAENGKQFSENGKIVMLIQPDVGFFQPSESYLQFRVKVNTPAGKDPTRLQLDADLGGHVLIKNIRILTGTGVLIEEIQDYNVLSNLMYTYDTDPSLRNKRSLTEGITLHNSSCRINNSNVAVSNYTSSNHNPYFSSPPDGKSEQQWAKLQLPLNTGIFRNKKIFPVVMTTGLRVEIMLEEAKKCIHQLQSLNTAAYAPIVLGTTAANNEIAKTANFGTLFLDLKEVENCPFIVGEKVKVVHTDTGSPVDLDIAAAISAIELDNTSKKVKITFTPQAGPTADVVTTGAYLLSTSIAADYKPTYTLDEVEMVLQQIQVPPSNVTAMMKAMKEQGMMRYEFLTYENYKRSQLAGERQATMALQLNNAEIKSVLSIGTDSEVKAPEAHLVDYNQHGLVGIVDNSTSYQWMYNGILNPDRRVELTKLNAKQIEQQYLVELEKSLVVGGIPVKSFRKFLDNIVIGRAMALQQGSYDGRGKDFNLQISAEIASKPPVKSKLWMNFVAHVRAINISSDGVSIDT